MERYREDQIALLNLYDMLSIDSGLVDNGSDLIAVADDCKSTWLVVSIFGPKAPKGMEDSWLQTITSP